MQKLKLVAATILGTSLSMGLAAAMPAAHAVSLIPQQEGEIDLTNMNCIVANQNCIQTQGYTVKSLDFNQDFKDDGLNKEFGLSRLFVDKNATENNWGPGNQIKFTLKDEGTNPISDQYWFRPVAYDATGKVIENGRLEVGKFLFTLDKAYQEVSLDFFDVEDNLFSGIVEVNGQSVNNLLAGAGKKDDASTKSLKLTNVSSFVIQLGNPGRNYGAAGSALAKTSFSTGDGVRLSGLGVTKAVPEPTTTLGLGAMAVAGLLGLRRKKVSQVG
ncbi:MULTISPECIES: LEVG family PEP-CTERM protein [Nostocales]|uniref:Exosortase n=3 Tax=Nostocales TaxID=1161 RepID=A0A0C1MZ91_9CYAN|nr:LEVG family PEP-CTERM protein [Tolypothrix bouteillei]KAF3888854.1 PEP-CTERM sorting domain-containing protein [Tolypothrix bouteillei VB521301]